jgi:hypothetical protein
LQCCAAVLKSDVSKLSVLLHAKVSNDVGVFVGLAQEVHLAVGDAEAGGQHAFHGHVAIVKSTPEKKTLFGKNLFKN